MARREASHQVVTGAVAEDLPRSARPARADVAGDGVAEEMKNAGANYQLIVYGNAVHGFTHETATGQQPGVLYHAQTDARSSVAIQGLFDELFR
jgi:dienelactone hydrolase